MLDADPPQSKPVDRVLLSTLGTSSSDDGAGVEPAQSPCTGLTGLAQQMCFALYS